MTAPASPRTIALKYDGTIGIVNNGTNGRGFANPYDVAVSKDGRIFVLNRCEPERGIALRIGILNMDEDYLGEFGKGFGDDDDQFGLPTAITFDSQDRLHVTDEHLHRVTVFDSSGNFLSLWGEHGSGDGQFDGPAGIAFDADDNAYVVDQHNARVQKFTRDGDYLSQWGEAGNGEGQFDMPWGVDLDDAGNVYVADWRNDRVQKFTGDGQFLAAYGESGRGDGQFHRPSDVAVDGKGFIYVADWGNERVQVLGPEGVHQITLRGEATVSKWAQEFYDANTDEVETRKTADLFPRLPEHLRDPSNESTQIESYFWGPVSVSLDSQDRLYVTEHNRHRFQMYVKA